MAESLGGFACTDNPELLEAPEPVQVEGIEPWTYPEATLRWDEQDGIEGDD